MIPLELPPQVEQEIIQIAQAQNISVNDYLITKLLGKQSNTVDYDKLYELSGIRPLPSRPNAQVITNDYINELREQYGI